MVESSIQTTTTNLEKLKYILYWNEAYGTKEYWFCCGQGSIVCSQIFPFESAFKSVLAKSNSNGCVKVCLRV